MPVNRGFEGVKPILSLNWQKQMNKKFFFQQIILIFAVLSKKGANLFSEFGHPIENNFTLYIKIA
jgi:hypothetical protein